MTVTDIDTSGISTDSQTLVISGTLVAHVKNAGDTTVTAPFDVTAFEDTNHNGTLENGIDLILGTTNHATGILAGDTAGVSISLSGTVSFSENIIYVKADSNDTIIESHEGNNSRHTGQASQFIPPIGSFNPAFEWTWTSSPVFPSFLNVMNTPAVIDINSDGTPDVIFGATNSTGGALVEVGVLRALNGADGSEIFTVTDSALRVNTAASVAVGDIDNDGSPEIIACDASGRRLIAFEHDGSFKWRSPFLEPINWGAPAIADIDTDGTPEIIMGRQVLNSDGTVRWTGSTGRASQGNTGPISLAADIDMDTSPDIVAGNTVYNANGTVKWNAPLPDGHNAVGNFDADAFPEIVLVSGGRVWLLEHTGNVKWGPVSLPGGGVGGPPTIADYDSDGQPEIGVAGASRYTVFETNGSVKWAAVTQDRSSNRTGSSVFDFDGDGSAEVVYRDELKLRIYRGVDGTVLFETPMSSCTWHEYVLVADVDADGNAEIVAVANNNCGFGPQRGVFVIGDATDSWVATRPIWNQHTYHITNINVDGSIPVLEENNWSIEGLNNYRLNQFLPDEGRDTNAPDLVPSFVRMDQSNCPVSVEITARIGNGGSLLAPAGVNVSFYDGHPSSGGVLLGTVKTSTVLEPGMFEDVSLTWNSPTPGNHDIFVRVDDDGTGNGTINEGNEENNSTIVGFDICQLACIDDLQARAKSGKVQLTWTHVDADSYNVYRGTTSGGPYAFIDNTTSSYSTYLDNGVIDGQIYYYIVRPVANEVEYCDSNEARAMPEVRRRVR